MNKEKYKNDFYQFVQNLVDYECLGEYINSKTKVLIKHNTCGNKWEVNPNAFKNKGSRCPYCYGNKKKSNSDFLREFRKNKDLKNYIPIEKYKNNRTPIVIKHNVCGNKYKVTPYKILNENARCPYCQGDKGHNYKNECQEKLGYDYIVLSESQRHIDKVQVKHKKCGNYYKTSCNKILNNRKCPFCKSSKMEEKVRNILLKYSIHFKEQYRIQDCRNVNMLPFDFAIDINNRLYLVECQGRQHYENVDYFDSLEDIQYRDSIKKKYCVTKNIKLIEIKYDKNDIEKYLLKELGITYSLFT